MRDDYLHEVQEKAKIKVLQILDFLFSLGFLKFKFISKSVGLLNPSYYPYLKDDFSHALCERAII